ncbi:MAG: hypothetical protein N3B21_13815 [Clostridia bacterium]|nr:hypothetical protein [Clostridia bacterium]
MKFKLIRLLIILGILVLLISCSQSTPESKPILHPEEPQPETTDQNPVLNNPISIAYKNDGLKTIMQSVDADSINNMISSLHDAIRQKNANAALPEKVVINNAVTGNIYSSTNKDIVIVLAYGFNDITESGDSATLILRKVGEHFEAAFIKLAFGDINISLIDIDKDEKKEVFEYITSDFKGSSQQLTVLKDNGEGILHRIFHVSCAYTLRNSYESRFNYNLLQNKSNPELTDIILNLDSQKKVFDDNSGNHDEIIPVKPLKDQIVFTFDGTKYVPNKDTNGYIYFEF